MTYILSGRPVSISVDEFAIDAHLIDLLQANSIVPQIRFTQAPTSSEYEVLKLSTDLRKPVIDRFQTEGNVLRVFASFDFLYDLKAFFQ